jgi:hypothetical protein
MSNSLRSAFVRPGGESVGDSLGRRGDQTGVVTAGTVPDHSPNPA